MFTKEELANMQLELNWSGTEGLNIDTQRKLVEMLVAFLEEKGK